GNRPRRAGCTDQQVRPFDFFPPCLSAEPVTRRTGDARLIRDRGVHSPRSCSKMTDAQAPVRSRRPYLLRAMHEWITDSLQTPHLVVDASQPGVEVPQQYVQGGKIILNVSHSATNGLNMGNEYVSFRARFGPGTYDVNVPVAA